MECRNGALASDVLIVAPPKGNTLIDPHIAMTNLIGKHSRQSLFLSRITGLQLSNLF